MFTTVAQPIKAGIRIHKKKRIHDDKIGDKLAIYCI